MCSQVFVTHDSFPKWLLISLQTEETDGATFKDLILQSTIFHEGDLTPESTYMVVNGRKLCDNDTIRNGQHIHLCNRLPGGKGGFGSMLRAIGAQIEKTTNREACRDLSGRRLRDIAEEMRLKKWIAKQAEREQEKATRRREKLERRMTTPKHEFRDPTYDKQRSEIPEKVNDALMQGLAVSKSTSKRPGPEIKAAPKKPKLWLGAQEGSEDEVSSEEMETSSISSLSSRDDLNEMSMEAQGSSAKETPTSNTTVSQESPGTSKLSEEPADENPTHPAVPESSQSLNESSADALVQEVTTLEEPNATQDTDIFNLNDFDSAEQLESLGLDRLKAELVALGMKCGGTLQQRAERLFSVKGLSVNQIKPSLLARPMGKPKK